MALIKSISGTRGTIGGKVGDNLTPIDVVNHTAAYGYRLLQSGAKPKVVIGRDARMSGDMVRNLVASTLQGLGISVVDLDLSTTPTVAMAVPNEEAGGGIIITASHNPKQWNALKFLNEKGEFLSGAAGQEILDIAESSDIEFADVESLGEYERKDDYIAWHIEQILALPLVDVEAVKAKGFKIVVDAVNSTGAISLPPLLEALGCSVVVINEKVNGRFAHNPEPKAEHLVGLAQKVASEGADLGMAVDPDVDRLAFMSEDGEMFGEEYTLVAVADYVLQHTPGNTVSNLSSTRALRDVTEKAGQQHHASAVGEVNVVAMMKEVNAPIGGEGNGGIIYPELHYGRDALVGAALFLSHLAHFDKPVSFMRNSYPNYVMSKNKIELSAGLDLDRIFEKLQDKYSQQPQNTVDGLKIEFDKDWIHLRRSNTEPIIRIYTESTSEGMANNLANKIKSDISELMRN